MAKIDRLLRFGAAFDWLTPAAMLARGGAGRNVAFASADWARSELASAGVRTWGWLPVGDVVTFQFNERDAATVDRILGR